jgi:hypothetical protein
MIYTPEEYAAAFTFGGLHVSARTIKRRCRRGQLPGGHIAHKKTGGWIIEVERFSENIRKNYNITLVPKRPATVPQHS